MKLVRKKGIFFLARLFIFLHFLFSLLNLNLCLNNVNYQQIIPIYTHRNKNTNSLLRNTFKNYLFINFQTAGMKDGDYIVAINEQDVKWSPHDQVVTLIKKSGNSLKLKLVTPMDKSHAKEKVNLIILYINIKYFESKQEI